MEAQSPTQLEMNRLNDLEGRLSGLVDQIQQLQRLAETHHEAIKTIIADTEAKARAHNSR